MGTLDNYPWLWISTPRFTVGVTLSWNKQQIIDAAPIVKWSIGKHPVVLLNWCKNKWPGEVRVKSFSEKSKIDFS